MRNGLIGIVVAAALVAGFGVAWFFGLLAPLYAEYPERAPIASKFPNNDVHVVAHRGHELVAPENTLPSFRAALDLGVEYLEVDMRVTKDGVPVVIHDATVDRTTNGSGQVTQLTFAEIRALDAGSWFSPEFAGVQVPTVEEVLNAANGRACILADLKAMPNRKLVELLR